MKIVCLSIEKPEDVNIILGQAHFIKTVDDLHESLAASVPGIRFGLAFCESSGPCLVRSGGSDTELMKLAVRNARRLSAGHVFVILLRGAYPINVLNAVKAVPEVCSIFCASSNPVEVVLAETKQGRGVLGVVDGLRSKGVESSGDVAERRKLLLKLGYRAA